jgi:hypothetical protein
MEKNVTENTEKYNRKNAHVTQCSINNYVIGCGWEFGTLGTNVIVKILSIHCVVINN